MTTDQLLQRFGLPANTTDRLALLDALADVSERRMLGTDDEDELILACIQVCSIGDVRDSVAIWAAKNIDFDASCYIGIQLVCGAGLDETKNYLRVCDGSVAAEALSCIELCETTGDFEEFRPGKLVAEYRSYFGLD